MEKLLRYAFTVRPGRIGRLALNGAGTFCAFTLIWEHLITVQSSEGPSMYPTFNPRGDWLLVSRLHSNGKGIQVGDVVRFNHPTFLGVHAAKRVIGMPGDFVCRDPPLSTEAGKQPDMIQVFKHSRGFSNLLSAWTKANWSCSPLYRSPKDMSSSLAITCRGREIREITVQYR